jgi:ElaA protein
MKIVRKTFKELTTQELYNILQLRAQVFVVEQDCVYQDLDGKDQKSWHVMGIESNDLVAYTRIFAPGDYFENASIGRVVVNPKYRGKSFGKEIMTASINSIEELFGSDKSICISAQYYLLRFYNDLGFMQEGETYLEDGIPHIKMIDR